MPRDAAIEMKTDDASLHVWVDANPPLVRVQCHSASPRQVSFEFGSLRPMQSAADPLPSGGTVSVLFENQADRLARCYPNQSSAWAVNFARQNAPGTVAKAKDPILHRTSGCVLRAADFVRESKSSLISRKAVKDFDCSIRILSSQADSLAAWLAEAEKPVKSDWLAHQKYWRAFWNRSHIFVTSYGQDDVNLDQYRFTQFPTASGACAEHKLIPAAQILSISVPQKRVSAR